MYRELEKYLKEEIFVKGNRIKLNNYIPYSGSTYVKYSVVIFKDNNEIWLNQKQYKLIEVHHHMDNTHELSVFHDSSFYLSSIFNEIKEGNFTYV